MDHHPSSENLNTGRGATGAASYPRTPPLNQQNPAAPPAHDRSRMILDAARAAMARMHELVERSRNAIIGSDQALVRAESATATMTDVRSGGRGESAEAA